MGSSHDDGSAGESTAMSPPSNRPLRCTRRGPRAIDAVAVQLPFETKSFDASMATFTVHQWRDPGP